MLPRQYWRVVSHPGAATFAEEQVYASWGAVWVQLIAIGILSVIFTTLAFSIILPALISTLASSSSSSYQSASLQDSIRVLQASTIPYAISSIFSTIVGFFAGTGILWLIAKMFGGQGRFLPYCYCYLLINIPITIASFILSFLLLIPGVGLLGSFAVWVYSLVLLIFMTMGVHRMSGGRATLAVLLLPILGIILSCILFFVLIAFITSVLHGASMQ